MLEPATDAAHAHRRGDLRGRRARLHAMPARAGAALGLMRDGMRGRAAAKDWVTFLFWHQQCFA